MKSCLSVQYPNPMLNYNSAYEDVIIMIDSSINYHFIELEVHTNMTGPRHAKSYLKALVIVVPKEG